MSEKIKMEWFELWAVIVAALFVVAPLTVHPAEKLIEGNGYAAADNGPKSWHSYEWATLGVLIFQAWIFRRQAGISDRQRELMKMQLDLSKVQHAVLHRPKVIIRQVEIVPDTEAIANSSGLVSVKYTIVNVGGTKAIIQSTGFILKIWRKNVREMPLDEYIRGAAGANVVIHAGQSHRTRFSHLADWAELTKIFDRQDLLHELVFAGAVVYKDDAGITRRTHVWRKLNTFSMNFPPGDNPEYEYTD